MFTQLVALLGREYGRADVRWNQFDSCLISMELLTVLVLGPLCLLTAYTIVKRAPCRHFLQIIVSVCELYGGRVLCKLPAAQRCDGSRLQAG